MSIIGSAAVEAAMNDLLAKAEEMAATNPVPEAFLDEIRSIKETAHKGWY